MLNISLEDKFFVAGASGMVGSSICRSLKKKGFEKNLLSPSRKELNLLDLKAVDDFFAKNNPTFVIIAAAKVGGILANDSFPYNFLLENLKIQNNLIEISFKYKVKKLLFLGSSCIYPKFANQPIREESLLTGELEPTNEWYALAKIAGIKLCQALRKQYNFNAICLMPTNLYGPGDNYNLKTSHVLPALIRKFHEASYKNLPNVTCWGSGKPEREFLHVDDLGDACVFAIENWDPESKNAPLDSEKNPLTFLNVGTGKDITIKNLAEKIAKSFNYKGEILWDKSKPDGTPKKQLDISRIKKLGWEPKISLDQGIESTISLFKKEIFKNEIRQ